MSMRYSRIQLDYSRKGKKRLKQKKEESKFTLGDLFLIILVFIVIGLYMFVK